MAIGAAALPAPPRPTTASFFCLLLQFTLTRVASTSLRSPLCFRLLHRLCNPAIMSAHERRNSLDVMMAGASLEYLVYGKFSANEEDKGLWDTRWCALADLLEQQHVTTDEVSEAIDTWREAEEEAREGLFALAAPAEE